ncbi:helix-hairpin-helix domain-containing protein [Clostridium sp. 'White wine YQ']|uniref:helix-hairpin-helix domain-containing protein n=1 Tax=Clostridium sp. 'White wine YQ' TaxID=3027474 RepID=UPI0023657CD1|nr:helix-hairpin-helix domain-containing protein [Clostridium sp. 'White wine YQ']MDD7794862.1 helix-hairpin-helix domain-containing protein [Clostridium sp. 'White wine YQ']
MRITRKEKLIGIVILLIVLTLVAGIYTYINIPKPLSDKEVEGMFVEETSNDNKTTTTTNNSGNIVVEIKGEIKKPEVYIMEKGSIIKDLIAEAGGLTEKADTKNINLAKELQNHECIVIGNIDNKAQNTQGSLASSLQSGKSQDGTININTATEAELDTLPGVGKVMAGKIIEYREKNGGFKSIEELKKIDRVGEGTFDKLKDKISI